LGCLAGEAASNTPESPATDSSLAATETTEERTFEAFEEDGSELLMADEEDSKVRRSQMGDSPSQTLLLPPELPT
jgi:hypothetical protein